MSAQPWGPPGRTNPPRSAPWGAPPGPGWAGPGYATRTAVSPGSGFPPYYGAPPPMPAPRRRSPLRGLMLAAVVVGLLLLGAMVAANQVSPTPQAQYQNEDYQVPPPDLSPPPLPVPETYTEAEALLTDNPLYRQTAPSPVQCGSQPINVGTASDADLEDHFNGLMECLMRVWEPPVTAARFQLVRPSVTVYGSQISTRCGTAEVNAFYCSADQQVYYSRRLSEDVPIVRQDKWAADVVMAHEFGHALQARTAILISSNALGVESGGRAEEYAFSRRLETQADCFAGQFVRSVSESLGVRQSDQEGIRDVFAAVGDDTLSGDPDVVGNHGRAASREYWGVQGLSDGSVGTCNTYTAPARLVR